MSAAGGDGKASGREVFVKFCQPYFEVIWNKKLPAGMNQPAVSVLRLAVTSASSAAAVGSSSSTTSMETTSASRVAMEAAAVALIARVRNDVTVTASNGVAIASVIAVEAGATIDEAAAIDVVRRIEAVAEGVPEQAIAGEPGVAEGAASPVPAGSEAAVSGVLGGEIDVGVAEVGRAEAAPFIEVVVLCLVLIEALRFGDFSVKD